VLWGEAEPRSTRRRVANSPDVKGVFGTGPSVVAVAPVAPDPNAPDVGKLFAADSRAAASLPSAAHNDNARPVSKNRGLWSEPREGSMPAKQTGSYSGPLPSAVTGTLSEPPISAPLSAAPGPTLPPSAARLSDAPALQLDAELPDSGVHPSRAAAAASPAPEVHVSEPSVTHDEPVPTPSQPAPSPSIKPRPRPSARRIPSPAPARAARRVTPLPLILLALGGVITGLALFFMGGSARLWPLPPSAAKAPLAPSAPASPPLPARVFAPTPAPEPEPPPTAAEEPAPVEAAQALDPSAVAPGDSDNPADHATNDVADPRLLALARTRLHAGDLRGAEAALRLALARAPDDHHAIEVLVQALIAQRRGAEAVPFAEQIVRKRPRRAAYRLLEGDAKELAGDRAGAVAAWRAALELDPDNAVVTRRISEHSEGAQP
jgi:hypothetical protein